MKGMIWQKICTAYTCRTNNLQSRVTFRPVHAEDGQIVICRKTYRVEYMFRIAIQDSFGIQVIKSLCHAEVKYFTNLCFKSFSENKKYIDTILRND